MSRKRIESRLTALEEILASPPPVRLLMGDGRIETMAVHEEDDLAFVMEILDRPVSRETELICDAVEILDQPGHLVELLQSVVDTPNAMMSRPITADDDQRFDSQKKVKPFGPRIKEWARRKPELDAWLNILTGSVRASKTWGTFLKIVQLCDYNVAGLKVITGVSKSTIYQNVLNDLFEILGDTNYSYNRQTGQLSLFGAKWLVIGAKDEGSEKYIRGATIGVAVCDELSLMPLSFWNMLLSRMSPKGARLYATTNPDSPYHWVKTEVLENPNYSRGLSQDLNAVALTLDDNPNLPEEYKERVKRSYTGLFYRRFILGEWVMAEGAIYRDVLTDDLFYNDVTRPVGLLHRNGHREHWISIDVGTVRAFAALDIYDDGRTLWVDRELYWDSQREGWQKTDAQYADDLVAFAGGKDNQRSWPGIIIDPAAAHFRTELIQRGFFVIDGENAVLEGIRKLSSMLGLKKIRIHERNKNLIGEMRTYSWNDKRAKLGFEEPVKDHDHAPDALRYYVHTRINDWRIAS